ncbi:MAG: NUDIX hydrolase [Candidatus Omnitrophica bacterium]|nr:NUDIX hydrolase [Candidatus Omnitrophota bacterium]
MAQVSTVFRGKLLTVQKKKVKLPNGFCAELEIVKHPGAVLVIPFLTSEKVIILKQFRPVINSYLYELPAGTFEKGETPLNCAKREIIEEIGFRATSYKKLGKIYPVPGYSTEEILIFKATGLVKDKQAHQKDEIIKSLVVSKAKIKQLFKSGKIVDAKTICALSFCGWL